MNQWQALEGVALFGWSGSAALGGWLSDTYSYLGSFTASTSVGCRASVCVCVCVCLVLLKTCCASPCLDGLLLGTSVHVGVLVVLENRYWVR